MLTPSFDPIIGGTETFVRDVTAKLNASAARVDVMTFNMDKKWKPKWEWSISESDGYTIYRIPGINPFNMSKYAGRLTKLHVLPYPVLNDHVKNYDVLHFHDDVDLTLPLACRFVDKPKILHCHTLGAQFDSYSKNRLAKGLLAKIVDIYIVASASMRHLLLRLGIKPDRIRIVPTGVDTELYTPNNSAKMDDLVLFVGRLEERKGLHILLESLDYLQSHVKIRIIGPSHDNDYSRKISDLLLEKSKKHDVSYLGPLDRKELIEWFQKASLFVIPSTSEKNAPFGIAPIEALACGTPVVASDVEGIGDLIRNQENGILVAPRSPQELANAIEYLINDPILRERLGQRGRQIVEEKFSMNAIARQLLEIYQQMATFSRERT